MKSTIPLLTILILNLISFNISSQGIGCNSFCLTDVRMDTSVPKLMYVALFFSGDNNDFINYPWIAEVINDQGDTVGVGTWNFFGQFGNTSNDYPVMVEFDSIPENFSATMVFHYDTSVCLLSFPCTTGIENLEDQPSFSIYPNPFSSETVLHSEIPFHDLTIKVFNLLGKQVKQLNHLSGDKITLKREDLLPGVYFMQLLEKNKVIAIRRAIISG